MTVLVPSTPVVLESTKSGTHDRTKVFEARRSEEGPEEGTGDPERERKGGRTFTDKKLQVENHRPDLGRNRTSQVYQGGTTPVVGEQPSFTSTQRRAVCPLVVLRHGTVVPERPDCTWCPSYFSPSQLVMGSVGTSTRFHSPCGSRTVHPE